MRRPGPGWIAIGAAAVLLTLLLATGEQRAIDRALLLALRMPGAPGVPRGPGWLLPAARDVTALGSPTVLTLATLAAVALLVAAGRARTALVTAVAAIGGATLVTLVKGVVARSRPALVPHLVEVTGNSFPSGHAANSAVIYLTLAALAGSVMAEARARRTLRTLAILLVGAIGVTRVYLGVHWPSDVAAGWCFGALWAWGWWRLGARWRVTRPA